jgi:hypothetical protein
MKRQQEYITTRIRSKYRIEEASTEIKGNDRGKREQRTF